MKKKSIDAQENKSNLIYVTNTLITLAESFDEKSDSLKNHLGDYLTVDIATEWEKEFMDTVSRLYSQNIMTIEQFCIFEKIYKQFTNFSNPPLYEKEIWTLEGLKSHPFWEEQRRLAKELLAELNGIEID